MECVCSRRCGRCSVAAHGHAAHQEADIYPAPQVNRAVADRMDPPAQPERLPPPAARQSNTRAAALVRPLRHWQHRDRYTGLRVCSFSVCRSAEERCLLRMRCQMGSGTTLGSSALVFKLPGCNVWRGRGCTLRGSETLRACRPKPAPPGPKRGVRVFYFLLHFMGLAAWLAHAPVGPLYFPPSMPGGLTA